MIRIMRNFNTNWKKKFLLDALCSEAGDWDQNSTHVNGSCHLLKYYNDWMIYKSLLVSTPMFLMSRKQKKYYEVILWNVCTVHNFEQMAFPFLRNYVIPKFDMVGIILIIWYYHFILLSMTFNWMNIIAYSRLLKLSW